MSKSTISLLGFQRSCTKIFKTPKRLKKAINFARKTKPKKTNLQKQSEERDQILMNLSRVSQQFEEIKLKNARRAILKLRID